MWGLLLHLCWCQSLQSSHGKSGAFSSILCSLRWDSRPWWRCGETTWSSSMVLRTCVRRRRRETNSLWSWCQFVDYVVQWKKYESTKSHFSFFSCSFCCRLRFATTGQRLSHSQRQKSYLASLVEIHLRLASWLSMTQELRALNRIWV